jgi:hypothetical protein
MLSRWNPRRLVLVLARLGGWRFDFAPGGLALVAQRWSTSVATCPAGLVSLASRVHASGYAVVFGALWISFVLLGLCLYQRALKSTSQ